MISQISLNFNKNVKPIEAAMQPDVLKTKNKALKKEPSAPVLLASN